MSTARLLLCLLMFICSIPLSLHQGSAEAETPPVVTHAKAAALIDVGSGRILLSQDGNKRMRIASLTKIMTAIVAIENGNLSDKVKVSKSAFGVEGSSIYLKLGEEMSLHHLLYGLMLRSGNDAAAAIAEHVGGSIDGFVYLMNQKARELGLANTQFKNPHGLDMDGHYSSANDLAVLTAYGLKNPVFHDIVKTQIMKVPNPAEDWDYKWYNKNKMLSLYEGADGVKTGYTKLAKRCLVSSATRGGRQLAVVTLDDRDDWADHSRLLDYGFQHFTSLELAKEGDRIEGNTVVARSFTYPLSKDEDAYITRKIEWYDKRSVSYRLGERGKMLFYLKGGRIGAVPLFDMKRFQEQTKEPSAFQFKETVPLTSEKRQWKAVLRSVFRALFTLQA